MSERQALQELFEVTKGAYWYRKWNWCSELSYGQWDGVTVDLGGHVKELDLRENYLQGSLDSLHFAKRLVNLDTLILSSNFIGGALSPSMGMLVSMQVLDLSWNRLSGNIPEELYSLSALRVLRLDNNQFSGQVSNRLGQLVNLVNLNLSRNKLSGGVPDVGYRLLQLKVLDLTENDFDGFVPKTGREYQEMHGRFLS